MLKNTTGCILILLLSVGLCGPGHSQERQTLLGLVENNGQVHVRDGWSFVDVEMGRLGVVYTFLYQDQQVLEVVVQRRDPRGHAFATTENLTITYVEKGPASHEPDHASEVYAFVRELAAVMADNDDGTVFQRSPVDPHEDSPEKYIWGSEGKIAQFGDGWEYKGFAVHPDRITYSFASPSGGLDVSISPMDSRHKAFQQTDSFKIWYSAESRVGGPGGSPGDLERFLARFVEVVQGNDDGSSPFGAVAALNDHHGQEDQSPLQRVLVFYLFLLWLAAPIALYFLARLMVGEFKSWSRNEVWGMAALTVAALGARLIAPAALVKVGMVFPLLESSISLESLPRYGAAGPVLYNLLFLVFPIHTSTILWFHCLAGSATVLLATVLARRLFGPGLAPFLGGLFIALTPVFVRDANSESLLVPAVFLLFAGALLLDDGLSNRRIAPGAAAALFFVLAGAFRPELVLVALAFGAWVFWAAPGRQAGSWRYALLVLAAAAAGLLMQVAWVVTAAGSEFTRGNLQAHRLDPIRIVQELWSMDLLTRPLLFPLSTVLLAGAGLVGAWFDRPRRPAVWGAAGLALVWLVTTYIDINEESILRLHVPAGLLLSLVAGYGAATLTAWKPSPLPPRAAAGAVVLLFLLSAGIGIPRVFFKTNSQVDARAFEQAMAQLPQGPVRLVRLGPEDEPTHALSKTSLKEALHTRLAYAPVHRFYPDYLLRKPLRDDQLGPVGGIRDIHIEGLHSYFYLSAQCYAYLDAGGQSEWSVVADSYVPMHPACRWALQNYAARPVWLTNQPNYGEFAAPFKWYPDSLKSMTLGLFEIGEPMDRLASPDPFVNVANWYHEQARPFIAEGDWARAQSILSEGEKNLPQSVTMWRIQASFAFLTGAKENDPERLRRSIEYWERIASTDIHFRYLLSKMGAVFSIWAGHVGKEQAKAYIAARLDAHPNDTVGLYLGGVVSFYAEKDYDATREAMERVMKVVDDDPRVYIYLALSHFYQGRQETAEKLVLRAVKLGEDQDPDVFYVRSIVFRHKDLDAAVRDIERYLEMSQSPEKVKFERKQKWLRKELENLRNGKPSPWWTTKTPDEPWNEDK